MIKSNIITICEKLPFSSLLNVVYYIQYLQFQFSSFNKLLSPLLTKSALPVAVA